MPTTPAGKLDHAALAAAAEAPAVGRIVGGPPRTAVERQMAELWAKLLNAEAIGRTDNFFDLGGHSLVAMQLLSRVRAAFGTEVTMADFFDDPTIAGLASLLEAETARA
jgi:aryl carrier-like protein